MAVGFSLFLKLPDISSSFYFMNLYLITAIQMEYGLRLDQTSFSSADRWTVDSLFLEIL